MENEFLNVIFSPFKCQLRINAKNEQCKIIFNGMSDNLIEQLFVTGQLEVVPDLADAVTKFPNLRTLLFTLNEIKIVRRNRLTPFAKIDALEFLHTKISRLDADTFNDLRSLTRLSIFDSKLQELHADIFAELNNLEVIYLSRNQLETIPAGLFRNNGKLKEIYLERNRLRRIEINLSNFSQLTVIYLSSNVCINEDCKPCTSLKLIEVNRKIQDNCGR